MYTHPLLELEQLQPRDDGHHQNTRRPTYDFEVATTAAVLLIILDDEDRYYYYQRFTLPATYASCVTVRLIILSFRDHIFA